MFRHQNCEYSLNTAGVMVKNCDCTGHGDHLGDHLGFLGKLQGYISTPSWFLIRTIISIKNAIKWFPPKIFGAQAKNPIWSPDYHEFRSIRWPEIPAVVLSLTHTTTQPINSKFHQNRASRKPKSYLSIPYNCPWITYFKTGKIRLQHELLGTDSSTWSKCWQSTGWPKWT